LFFANSANEAHAEWTRRTQIAVTAAEFIFCSCDCEERKSPTRAIPDHVTDPKRHAASYRESVVWSLALASRPLAFLWSF